MNSRVGSRFGAYKTEMCTLYQLWSTLGRKVNNGQHISMIQIYRESKQTNNQAWVVEVLPFKVLHIRVQKHGVFFHFLYNTRYIRVYVLSN